MRGQYRGRARLAKPRFNLTWPMFTCPIFALEYVGCIAREISGLDCIGNRSLIDQRSASWIDNARAALDPRNGVAIENTECLGVQRKREHQKVGFSQKLIKTGHRDVVGKGLGRLDRGLIPGQDATLKSNKALCNCAAHTSKAENADSRTGETGSVEIRPPA